MIYLCQGTCPLDTLLGNIKPDMAVKVDASASWLRPPDLYDHLQNRGFSEHTVANADDIYSLAKSGNVQPGDAIIFMKSHAGMVTDVDVENGIIYYSAHTEARLNRNLARVYDKQYGNIHIFHVNYPGE